MKHSLTELLVVVAIIAIIVGVPYLYIVIHFLHKFW